MDLSFLKRLSVKLEQRNNAIFSYPIENQKTYMKSLRAPKNDFERAYNQYKCQMKLNGKIITFFLNIVSFPLFILFYWKKNDTFKKSHTYNAVFFSGGIPENVIPDILKKEFSNWFVLTTQKEYLSKKDKKYIRKIIRKYPFSWHFLLKCIIKIRFYSYTINAYKPNAIVVCGEYSFTSSVLTHYCAYMNVKHINVMHGEKLFFMRDSFFRFDRCYVWSEEYIDLFEKLYADKEQFLIAIPESMNIQRDGSIKQTIDYTYYLGAEKDIVLDKIINNLNKLRVKGYKVAVRPHPRYSDKKMIEEKCNGLLIEDINQIDIKTSILRTKNVISSYSTVLNQAYHCGVGIVIDDITNPQIFKKLKELNYIVFDYNPNLLSDYV